MSEVPQEYKEKLARAGADSTYQGRARYQTRYKWNALIRAWRSRQSNLGNDYYKRQLIVLSEEWRLVTGLEGPTAVALGR